MIRHNLKIKPRWFNAVEDGRKPFEVRSTVDRRFEPGDVLHLREFVDNAYTGRECTRIVSCVLTGAPYVPEGYAILGLNEPARAGEVTRPYGKCAISGPAEDVSFVLRHLPDAEGV